LPDSGFPLLARLDSLKGKTGNMVADATPQAQFKFTEPRKLSQESLRKKGIFLERSSGIFLVLGMFLGSFPREHSWNVLQ
jgi:hypothetical protein